MHLVLRLIGLVIVLGLIAIGGLLLLPADKLGKIASDQLSSQLGRDVVLGDARVSVWPVAGVQANSLRVANPSWAGSDPMLTAKSAAFGLDASALLTGRFAFKSVTIDSPTLRLISENSGRSNWQLDSDASTTTGQSTSTGSPPEISLENLSISDATVLIQSDTQNMRIENANLTLAWPDPSGPMTLDGALDKDRAPLRIKTRIGKPRTLLDGLPSPASVTLGTAGGDIQFDGRAGTAGEAQGRVTLALNDTAKAVAALAQVGLELPEGLGRSVSGAFDITLTSDGRVAVRDGALQLDGNALTIAADVTLADKPVLNAQIGAEALDLSGLMGGAAEPSGGGASSEGWSTTPIDASGLSTFDGQIALTTGSLKLGEMDFGTTRALMSLDNSRAVFELRELRGYDGLVTGTFVTNNRDGLSARADVSITDVSLRPLLSDAMDIDDFSGPASGFISVLGWGSSIAEIMSNLKGNGTLSAGPGRIEGIDLEAAVGGNASGGTTIFDVGTASFSIEGGVLRNSDLALALPRLKAKGEGAVDLGRQSLDYLVTVMDPKARGGRGLAFPVRIKGPWSATTIRVDAGELIDQNLAEERDKLKDKAREKINEAIQDKLGVTVAPDQSVEEALENKAREELNQAVGKELGVTVPQGQSVEDALKGELEKRARDGLLNLLGR